jgi:hypothetical protein
MSHATEQMQKARWGSHGSDWPDGFRQCMKCEELKPTSKFHKHAMCKGGFNSVCKQCRKPLSAKSYTKHSTVYKLWYRAKRRAKERGQEFDIQMEDIQVPELCPVFGVPFEENTIYAASLDRIDSTRGYVKDNIQVLSNRANTLKNDATADELERLLQFMRRSSCEVL